MRRFIIPVAVIALAGVGGPAFAHPRLVSADPAPNAAVGSVNGVRLAFSERLLASFSKADLLLTSTPTARLSAPIHLQSRLALSSNGRGLIVTPTKRLVTGSYRLTYRVVSADTHRIQGGYAFTVK